MITEDYVSYETAKLLKEKGFEGEVHGCYHIWDGPNRRPLWSSEIYARSEAQHLYIQAPTLQMAMKWLREVHSILVVIDYNYECTSKSYCYKIYHLEENGKPKRFPVYGIRYDDEGNENKDIIYYRDFQLSYSEYTTYKEAAEAAIYYCLEYLI